MKIQSKKEGLSEGMSDKIFDIINHSIMTLIILLIIYPLYYIVIASISSPDAVGLGKVWIYPVSITFEGYKRIFKDEQIWLGYRNVMIYTFFGTILNITITMMLAYTLSRKKFFLKKALMIYITITMYFGGGLIPTYLVVKRLGLYDSWLIMIIMGAVNVFNVIVARTFIQGNIADELYDASMIDGCSHIRFFIKIVFPLSKAIIAVLMLYYGVSHWNNYFTAMIYIQDQNKYPLQLILRRILIQNLPQDRSVMDMIGGEQRRRLAELIKFGVIIVSSAPVLILYPFLQKFFVKGVMIGSLKG